MAINEVNINIPIDIAPTVFGAFDENIKIIEKALLVSTIARDEKIKIIGESKNVAMAVRTLETLCNLAQNKNEITKQTVLYTMELARSDEEEKMSEIDKDIVCKTFLGKTIKPKTLGQKKYIDLLREKTIVFGIGPAGTGKTYLAIACAVLAFKKKEVERIILTRPAIEAGEKLGFLPGDLQSKVDPYLRPLYDALFEIMGAESFNLNMSKGLIEVAPLAYMRGRTLDNAYVILDEAQNTTTSQMKMFLTRIGFNSRAVITGDRTQKDLPSSVKSGLDDAIKVLAGIDEIGFSHLSSKDVVRHPLVQKIVKAYEKSERVKNEH